LLALIVAMLAVGYFWRPWEGKPEPKVDLPDKPGPVQTEAARVEHAELHIQRGEGEKPLVDSLLLVDGGEDRAMPGTIAPMDRKDRFVLLYKFAQPTPWYLVHVDPEGGAAVVASSPSPQIEVRIPEIEGVAFSQKDKRGVNLLLLLAGELPAGATEDSLDADIGKVRKNLEKLPVFAQTRSGLEGATAAAVQLPQDYLRAIERQIPPQLKPRHALFLKTTE